MKEVHRHSVRIRALTSKISGLFRSCLPVRHAPPVTEHVKLQSKQLCKKWHVRLGVANNMHPLTWGWGNKRKRSKISTTSSDMLNCFAIVPTDYALYIVSAAFFVLVL